MNIQQFYLLLKLGIFKSGKVADWGYVSLDSRRRCFLRKSVAQYELRPLIKKQLDVGLYLLDLYLLEKNDHRNTHIMVVSVHRAAAAQTKVYVLRLTTLHKAEEVKAIVEKGISATTKYMYKMTDGQTPLKLSRRHYINDVSTGRS
jgi:hypothetical protein